MTRGTLVVKMTRNKRCRICAAFAIACLFALEMSAEDQPKKYDLKLDWNAVEGHKTELSQDGLQAMMMKVLNGDGKILKQQEHNESRSFAAVEVKDGFGVEPGVWFRLGIGGITGHRDFAKDTGIIALSSTPPESAGKTTFDGVSLVSVGRSSK